MARPKLHLDATDERQLLGATAHGRCIFTFNARDFAVLAGQYPEHGGIILAAQTSWTLARHFWVIGTSTPLPNLSIGHEADRQVLGLGNRAAGRLS